MLRWRPLACVLAIAACDATAGPVVRLWVDTDAACEGSWRRDVDDCVALLHLARRAPERVHTIASVFGNASREEVDDTLARLVPLWTREAPSTPPLVRGARAAGACDESAAPALIAALASERLEILALGPLTNVACAIAVRPDLRSRIARVVAVMGARPGHVFHPAEDRAELAALAHGPVFDDVNVSHDAWAVSVVLASGVPLWLMPYESARSFELRAEDLDRLAREGGMPAAVASAARPWLAFWRSAAGRDGFYPFDLAAALVATTPEAVACEPIAATLTADRAIGWLGFGPRRLLLGALPWRDAEPPRPVAVCKLRSVDPEAWLSPVSHEEQDHEP